jgi:hypothetical protein
VKTRLYQGLTVLRRQLQVEESQPGRAHPQPRSVRLSN